MTLSTSLEVIGDHVTFVIQGSAAHYPLIIDPTFKITQQAYLKARNTTGFNGYLGNVLAAEAPAFYPSCY